MVGLSREDPGFNQVVSLVNTSIASCIICLPRLDW